MKVPINYRNRKPAYVKHHLLSNYLEKLFMIIGKYYNNIRYVDCFSGPWQEGSENLEDTSIGIALNLMEKCRKGLARNDQHVTFHALFIEKDKNAYEKLETYLADHAFRGVQTAARNGEFYDLRNSILQWCGKDDFTFFFIDPTGWKNVIEIPTLEPFLRRPNSEFLITFMYDFLLRAHTQEPFQEDMRAIFGYTPDTTDMSPKEREAYLVRLYSDRLKETAPVGGGAPRTAHVSILYPLRDRTLYELIYLTRHPKGIVVFMEASEKSDLVQRRVRAQAKQEHRVARNGQFIWFSPHNDIELGDSVDLEKVKSYWLRKLSFNPERFGVTELADMLEETGWFISDFQKAFGELTSEGLVENLNDTSKRRRSKYVHFNADGNRGELLIRVAP